MLRSPGEALTTAAEAQAASPLWLMSRWLGFSPYSSR